MLGEFDLDPQLTRLTDGIVASYEGDPRTRHVGREYSHRRGTIAACGLGSTPRRPSLAGMVEVGRLASSQ